MAAAIQFKKAVKFESKGRVALVGPAGSGKSFTALMIARMLVGPEGKIAAVDTEHGSLSKYAHTMKCGGPGVCEDASHHDFDVVETLSLGSDCRLAILFGLQGRETFALGCCLSLRFCSLLCEPFPLACRRPFALDS